jgi:hypothetical protein
MPCSIQISEGFTNQEGIWIPWPSLEIFRDGNIWGHDEGFQLGYRHFRYGVAEWRLVLEFLDIVKPFSDPNGGELPREPMAPREFMGGLYTVKIEVIDGILHGVPIEKPILKFIKNNEPLYKPQFGVIKAGAIIKVEDEIRQFVNAH